MSLPDGMHGRRHTQEGLPDSTVPTRRHSRRSGTMSVCSDDLTNQALPSPPAPSQTPLQNRSSGDWMMLGSKAGQSSCSLSSNVSFDSFEFSAESALYPSPMSISPWRSTLTSGRSRYPSNHKLSLPTPRRFLSILEGETVESMGRTGSLTHHPGEPLHPVSLALDWWQTPLTMGKSPSTFSDHLRYSRADSRSSMVCSRSANSITNNIKQPLMSRLRSRSDDITFMHRNRAFISQLAIPDEEPSDRVEIATSTKREADPEDSIRISVHYETHAQRLTVQINSLTCVDARSNCTRNLVVELTLSPAKQRHVVSVPSAGDTLPESVVFEEVRSFSLASRSLSVKVCPKGLFRKTGRVLYQTSIPLTDVSLIGDANWVTLKPVHTKVAGFVSICMCYQVHKGKLIVTVIKAKGLKKSTLRKGSYVEVKLLRGRGEKAKIQTVRTKSHSGGQNPVYKEAFSLELPPTGLCYTELTFTVRRWNLAWADEVLGRATLSSEMLLRWKKTQSLENTLDEVFRYPGKVVTQCHPLITHHANKTKINVQKCTQ